MHPKSSQHRIEIATNSIPRASWEPLAACAPLLLWVLFGQPWSPLNRRSEALDWRSGALDKRSETLDRRSEAPDRRSEVLDRRSGAPSGPKGVLGSPQGRPKSDQGRPKSTQRGPKGSPEGPRERQNRPQVGLRSEKNQICEKCSATRPCRRSRHSAPLQIDPESAQNGPESVPRTLERSKLHLAQANLALYGPTWRPRAQASRRNRAFRSTKNI